MELGRNRGPWDGMQAARWAAYEMGMWCPNSSVGDNARELGGNLRASPPPQALSGAAPHDCAPPGAGRG